MSDSYTVRIHPRARHVRLRIDPREGLIVTVPPRFDHSRIPALLAQRRDWIEAVGQRQASLRAACAPALSGPAPERVELPAIDRHWRIAYRPGAATAQLREYAEHLAIALPGTQPSEQPGLVAGLLRRWLVRRAHEALGGQLAELAAQHHFRYQRISIRFQRSRWGSCSARGGISLNARLMFCPPEAVRYVLIHELAHTEHLHHGPAFWDRVAELMPDYIEAQRSLKQVWQCLPDWA